VRFWLQLPCATIGVGDGDGFADDSLQAARTMRATMPAFLIGVEGVTEVWLVRHADCYEGMSEGADPQLSPLGRKQAELLAKRVRKLEPAAIYSSPYRRALETARTIADDVHVDDRLVEMEMELGDDGALDFKELPASVIERMSGAIDDIAHAHPGGRVIVVAHGAAMIVFLTHVLRLEPGHLRFLPYFTSVNIVRVLGDRQMVGTLGDTAHLE
jgi:probable phosphoglycerate mutase